jgi:hypothetical protein
MRWTIARWMGTTGLVLLATVAPLRADESDLPFESGPAATETSSTVDAAIGVLRLRLQARLDLAALLERQGRVDEAIDVLRGVEDAYARGWEDIARLLARPVPSAAPVPIEETPRTPEPRRTVDAVDHGLRWLAAHQSPDGRWEAARFHQWCDGLPADLERRPDGLGKETYDVGVTGIALCAFLTAGFTNRGNHAFAATVSKGLRYLKNVQDAEGCFGPRASAHYVYDHAWAALAMVQAYGLTESPIFRGSAQKALDFIALARNPYLAWRYGVKPGENDTSTTGVMFLPLAVARAINEDARSRGRDAPLVIDEEAFEGAHRWIEQMTDPDTGRVGYMERGGGPARPQEMLERFPPNRSEALTAIGVLVRLLQGETEMSSPAVAKGLALMSLLPPRWEPEAGTIDMMYWYYGTQAMHLAGGEHWRRWSAALNGSVLRAQRLDGTYCEYRGSWDPIDPWSPDGGRVYATGLMHMCLSVLCCQDSSFPARPARAIDIGEAR